MRKMILDRLCFWMIIKACAWMSPEAKADVNQAMQDILHRQGR